MNRKQFNWVAMFCAAMAACAGVNVSDNTLSNGGFESGSLEETANDALGANPWLTSNSGGNAIAVTNERAAKGKYSLKWSPIGWNTKDDGKIEDAGAFIITNVRERVKEGATDIRVSGAVDTSDLDAPYSIRVTLANDTFTRINVENVLKGGVKGWQRFEASMPLAKTDGSVFLAFMAVGTSGRGAPGCAVYIDDLSLSYESAAKQPDEPKKKEIPALSSFDLGPPPEGERPFRMGFTPFPWAATSGAARDTYRDISRWGDIVCHHMGGGVPWPEALSGAPFPRHVREDWKKRKELTPSATPIFLALTPLNEGRDGLALYHGEKENRPLPAAFRDKALDHPDVVRAYITYCRRAVAHFQPEYLAIGIEVNNLVDKSPKKWPGFLTLYRKTRETLKKENPDLPIFASVTLHALFQESRNSKKRPQTEAVQTLLPEMDILGLSFYPFINTVGDPQRPAETFEWIREFANGKPLAVCETGFPAEPTPLKDLGLRLPGTLEGQATFTRLLLEAARRDRYEFLIEFLYRDYDALWEQIAPFSSDAGIAWRDCGLADGDGAPRPALEIWKRYYSLPLEDQ